MDASDAPPTVTHKNTPLQRVNRGATHGAIQRLQCSRLGDGSARFSDAALERVSLIPGFADLPPRALSRCEVGAAGIDIYFPALDEHVGVGDQSGTRAHQTESEVCRGVSKHRGKLRNAWSGRQRDHVRAPRTVAGRRACVADAVGRVAGQRDAAPRVAVRSNIRVGCSNSTCGACGFSALVACDEVPDCVAPGAGGWPAHRGR